MRTSRIIGALAILHATIIGGIVIGTALHGRFPSSRLWVAFVTLWVVWPIALLVHRGRSVLRFAVPVAISVLILWSLAWRDYALSAPLAVGLPNGVSIYPLDLYAYFAGHRAGSVEAEKDLRAGVLAIETYGFPMLPEYADILRDRYQIELRRLAGDTDITARVLGHARGYNKVSKPEIKRRFGNDVLEATAEEALDHWNAHHSDRSNQSLEPTAGRFGD